MTHPVRECRRLVVTALAVVMSVGAMKADTYIYATTDVAWPNMVTNTAGTARIRYYGNPLIYSVFYHEYYSSSNNQWEIGWVCPDNYSQPAHAVMQNDGNFVTYDRNWVPIWSTETDGNSGAYAAVQDDFNFVIYTSGGSPLWSMFDLAPDGCYY